MKLNLQVTLKKNPIDLRHIKQYHQILIEQKYNFYFSPIDTDKKYSDKKLIKLSDIKFSKSGNLRESKENFKQEDSLKNNKNSCNYNNNTIINSFNNNKQQSDKSKNKISNIFNNWEYNNDNSSIAHISNFFECL